MTTEKLGSPLVGGTAQFKRRASPPRFPNSPPRFPTSPTTMPLSHASPTTSIAPRHRIAGLGLSHRILLRVFIISAIVIPTLYILTSPTLDTGRSLGNAATEVMDEIKAGGGSGPREALRRMKQWGGGVKQAEMPWADGAETLPPEVEKSGPDAILDMDEDMPVSAYDGGVPGYSVFSNLYLSAGGFTFVEPESGVKYKKLPGTRQILSGPKQKNGHYPAADEERWRIIGNEQASGELGSRALHLKGVTYIFNDPPGGEGFLVYFAHFVAEAYLGATRVLAHTLSTDKKLEDDQSVPLPSRIWFPRCGWKESWRDERGDNIWFLAHTAPEATIEDANGWEDRISAGLPIIFQKVILVDRWSSHSVGGEVGKWGKMNAEAAALAAPRSYWDGYRRNVMRSLGVDGISKVGDRGLPVVVLVDSPAGFPIYEDRSAIIEALKGLVDIAEVHVTKLSAMTKPEQLELMGRAEIVIGQHTPDMYSALWMPATERSAVIEVFEEGGFDRGFELLATSLNHKYIAVQNDKILKEEEWKEMGQKRGEGAQSSTPVDGQLIVKIVRNLLR